MLSLYLTWQFNWNSGMYFDLPDDIDKITPDYEKADYLTISKYGILYNDRPYGKEMILEIDKDKNSRGLTLKRLNHPNWIDLIARALDNEITFESLTHEGTRERWLAYNGIEDDHMHDKEGAKHRTLNQTNTIMVERGITHLVINSTNYYDDEVYNFKLI